MKPSDLPETIAARIRSDQMPLFIWGPPGIGKSQIVRQTAQALDMDYLETRAALMDTVDARGVPSIDQGRTVWNVPAEFPTGDRKTLWFMDEYNQAHPQVQSALGQLLTRPGRLGDYELPPNVYIVAAGNEAKHRAAAQQMPSHIKNRFHHVYMEANVDDWTSYALSQNWNIEAIAFIMYRPELLNKFDPSRPDNAYPTPRSWEASAALLADQATPEPVKWSLIAGTVGEGAAGELRAFIKVYQSLPDLDAIRMGPTGQPIPETPAGCYAVAAGIARRMTPDSAAAYITYLDRLPTEYNVTAVKLATKQTPAIVKTRALIEWTTNHKDILF